MLLVEGTGCEAFDIQNILKNALSGRTSDFIAPMEENCVVVVRRLEEQEGEKEDGRAGTRADRCGKC